ncbi:MAG: type IX secretion system membrane protein PorP/SprF [Dysgonamonadaceae bacterium]|jgi:type IX secretion system PorP/SprF family membrane protein|nr:type IX secretion system membrane protein PorP/SprF [Dysgonamonadaceae bacterium]
MKKYIVISFLFVFSINYSLKAQFDTQLSNYWAVPNFFNPGYAGQSGKLELTGLYRLQWLGIENAPKSAVVVGDMPLKLFGKQHGVGVSMYNDRIGLFKSSVLSGQFSYKHKILNGDLGIGIQLGYINESFDGSKVKLPGDDESENLQTGSNDDAIPGTEVSGSSFDAAFGLFFSKKKWYVGLSVTHLVNPKLSLTDHVDLEIPRTYYFTAGYNIQLNNPLIELQPSVLVKTVELSSLSIEQDSIVPVTKENTLKGMWNQTQIDVSLRMVYNNLLWGGVSWRKDDAVVIMLGGRFKMFEIGYAYDFPISDIRTATTGSHELFLKYSMDMNLKKGKKGKYKSVRIL